MNYLIEDLTFKHPTRENLSLIYHWFRKPHVSEFFDDPEIGRSIPDLLNFLSDKDHFFTPWLAYFNERPAAYLMVAEVKEHETGIWQKWREQSGKTYSLDILIGDEDMLGKGLSHQLIKKFIQLNYPDAAAFLIDPELRNLRAIHVFEKAGFVIVDEFKGEHGEFAGIPHLMMKLKLTPSY